MDYLFFSPRKFKIWYMLEKEEKNKTSPWTESQARSDTWMEVVQKSQSSIGPLAGLSGGVSLAALNVN